MDPMLESLISMDQRQERLWRSRRPSFARSVGALFKKSFLNKIRYPAAMVELLGAFVLFNLVCPVHEFARKTYQGSVSPQVNYTQIIDVDMAVFFGVTKNPSVAVGPNTSNVHALMDPLIDLLRKNISIDCKYINTTDELNSFIYERESNGLGIFWVNSEADDAWNNPNIELYHQTIFTSPAQGFFQLIRAQLGQVTHKMQVARMNVSHQVFAAPQTTQIFDARIPVGFFALMPVIFSTMDDLQVILDEKDTKVAALYFLMGCPESVYWLVNITISFILSVGPHMFMGAMFCYVYLLLGTSFTMFMALSILFIIAHIMFQLFVSTFLKTSRSGRALTVTLCVFIYFFAILHFFFTLSPNNSSLLLKHAFQIVPFSAYQMAIMTMYTQCKDSLPPITWQTMTANSTYNMWWAFEWMIADIIIYTLLFVIFNATNTRAFGTPAIPWRDLFRVRSWRRLFFGIDEELVPGKSDMLMEVKNLGKTYFGYKTVHALQDVSFKIKQGEVIIVIGPNGAGKSTLMNTLSGTIHPTSGTIRLFDGPETNQFRDTQNILGICFQENVVLERLSIQEHFQLFGTFRGLSDGEIQENTEFFAETLQLKSMLANRANDLSGGQKRKLCIALSLLGSPPLVIMDEPAAGVDVEARQMIWKTISSLRDTTTIVTSHALDEAEAVSSRLFIVAGGKLAFAGTSTEMRKQFRCGYLLRIHGRVGYSLKGCLNFVRQYCSDASIIEDRTDTITMEVSDRIPELLEAFEAQKQQLGVIEYSYSVEQLEDVLMKLIQTEESQIQAK